MDENLIKPTEDNNDVTTQASPALDTPVTPTEDEVKDAELPPVPDNDVAEGVSAPDSSSPTSTPDNTVPDVEEVTPSERTFTQSQVDDIAGKTRAETRDKTFRYIYGRYGVNSEEELDNLVGNAQSFDSYKEQVEAEKKANKEYSDARDKELADIKEQVALMQSGIDNARYEDAKLILRGKGLEVNLENINNELNTHPEWKKVVNESKPFVKAEPVSKINVLGNEPVAKNSDESEEERAMRLFRV